jgi:hypothetical protein
MMVNIGEGVQVEGETTPPLDGTLILIPYKGAFAPEILRDIPVVEGTVSLVWTPKEAGRYMLVAMFVPEDSRYPPAFAAVKSIIVKDVHIVLTAEKTFYNTGETVGLSVAVTRKTDGRPVPYAKVQLSFADRTLEASADRQGSLSLSLTFPEDAFGEYTITAEHPPAQAAVKIHIGQDVIVQRVELIRGLPFDGEFSAKSISRAEYGETFKSALEEVPPQEWELAQQEYEALYILTEEENIKAVTESFFSGAVSGYYDVEGDEIVLVGEAIVDEETLVHELVHLLQDRHFPEIFEFTSKLTDSSFAVDALIEGDAELVRELYEARWGFPPVDGGAAAAADGVPWGFRLIQYFPYIEGLNFVRELWMQGGWEAVDQAYADPPKSTEQIIHPEKYGVDTPVNVTLPDLSLEEWEVLGNDTLGEFALFIMFWNQGIVPIGVKGDSYTYSASVSEGWDGDLMVVYKKSESYGYVWRIAWDSEADAEEFVDGYEWMLWRMGAAKVEGVWEIDSNDYVQILREGGTVTIINAPSLEELGEIWALSMESEKPETEI